MTLELASLPLAFLAGIVGILSPCVWPLVPVMLSSAATSGRSGPLYLSLGLATAFAIAGTLLTFVLLNLGLNPDAFRYVAAVMLILVSIPLLHQGASDKLSTWLSRSVSRFDLGQRQASSPAGQFGVGLLLGLVWLPCVGPTLGAAIALASLGQNMMMAATVMFVFGIGTALALLAAALLTGSLFQRLRPGVTLTGSRGKKLLGLVLLILGIMVLSGADKTLETWALAILPDWATQL